MLSENRNHCSSRRAQLRFVRRLQQHNGFPMTICGGGFVLLWCARKLHFITSVNFAIVGIVSPGSDAELVTRKTPAAIKRRSFEWKLCVGGLGWSFIELLVHGIKTWSDAFKANRFVSIVVVQFPPMYRVHSFILESPRTRICTYIYVQRVDYLTDPHPTNQHHVHSPICTKRPIPKSFHPSQSPLLHPFSNDQNLPQKHAHTHTPNFSADLRVIHQFKTPLQSSHYPWHTYEATEWYNDQHR